jgi:hypothetical protein
VGYSGRNIKAGAASKKAKRTGAREDEKKKERRKERAQKGIVDGAWTLRLRDHRLTLSFIMFIPQTGIVPYV